MTRQNRAARIEALIDILADGQIHSGETLAEKLGVSRTAINQYVATLEGYGLDVFRIPGRGYQLAKPLQPLNEHEITDGLAKIFEGQAPMVIVQRVVSSSNDVLRQLLTSTTAAGTTVLAEAQTSGRGRRGKVWYSPYGASLYLSIYWPLSQGIGAAMGLSVVVGIAIANALQRAGIKDVQLKWPNDVYVQGKKLAGILVELEGQSGGDAHAIIGIGINVELGEIVKEIDQAWIDLVRATGAAVDRNKWAVTLLSEIYQQLVAYERFGLAPLKTDWQRFDRFYQQPVAIITNQQTRRGVAYGIDEQGGLIIEIDGSKQVIYGGEVSLRSAEEFNG